MELVKTISSFDKKINLNLVFSFLYFSIGNIARLFSLVGVPIYVTYGVYFAVFAIYISENLSKMRLVDWVVFLFLLIMSAIGLLINYSFIGSLANIFATIGLFMPGYFYFRTIETEKLTRGFKVATLFNALFLVFYYFTVLRQSSWYDMSFGYWCAFAICALFYYFLKEKKLAFKLAYGAFASFLFVLLFIGGSRGALFFTIFDLAFIAVFGTRTKKARVFFITLIILAFLIFYVRFENLIDLLSEYGDSVRNIYKIASGKFLISDARNQIYENCKVLISNNPLGYGPLASRSLIPSQPYPHSIFYELQLDYGVFFGFVFFLSILFFGLFCLIAYRKNELFCLLSIICIVGIGSLFISSSLYIEYYIPAIIALFMKNRYESKQ